MVSAEVNGPLIAMLVRAKGQEGLFRDSRAETLGDHVVLRKPTRKVEFSTLNADNSM